MVTNGYRGKSVTFMGILMRFTLIRMLHEPSTLYYVLMAITIIKMYILCPIYAEQIFTLRSQRNSALNTSVLIRFMPIKIAFHIRDIS